MTDNRLFPATLMPDADWWQALWPDPAAVLRTVGIEPGMAVVDLCCGDGLFTAPLCALVQAGNEPAGVGRVWALDLDAELLAAAERACRGQPNFKAILADARELPQHLDGPVDRVLIANTFHGVPEQTALAAAVHASLTDGGRFVVINWYHQPREDTPVLGQPRGPDTALRMDPDAVLAAVEPAGFDLERVVDVGPYHYAAVFIKSDPTTQPPSPDSHPTSPQA